MALKPTYTPRPELRKEAANAAELPCGRPRRNTLHLARTRSFPSPARTHATHETKTKTKQSRSPGSGLPPDFPSTSNVALLVEIRDSDLEKKYGSLLRLQSGNHQHSNFMRLNSHPCPTQLDLKNLKIRKREGHSCHVTSAPPLLTKALP